MPGKGQLPQRGEDSYAVVCFGSGRPQQEGRLAQLGPGGELEHLLAAQAVGANHHGNGVAFEGLFGEDIDLLEG